MSKIVLCRCEANQTQLSTPNSLPKFFPLKSVESAWKVGGEVQYQGEVERSPFIDYGEIEAL